MGTETTKVEQLDHFFSTSAARMDRWRELNARAQTWAAARQGKDAPRSRRRWRRCAPIEDFFAYPGPRLMKVLQERIAADDALGVERLVRRMSGCTAFRQLSLRQRRMGDGRRRCSKHARPFRPRSKAARPAGRISRPCSSAPRRPQTARRSLRKFAACDASKTR